MKYVMDMKFQSDPARPLSALVKGTFTWNRPLRRGRRLPGVLAAMGTFFFLFKNFDLLCQRYGGDICAEPLSTVFQVTLIGTRVWCYAAQFNALPHRSARWLEMPLPVWFSSPKSVYSAECEESLSSLQNSLPAALAQPPLPLRSPCSRAQELEQMLLWIKRSCERKFGQAAPFCRPDPAAAPGCELSVCIAGDELQSHQQRWRRQKQERFKTGGNHFTRKISAISGRKLWKMLPFPSQNEGKIKLLPVRRAKVASPSREGFDNGKHLTAGLELSCSNSCYGLNEYFW